MIRRLFLLVVLLFGIAIGRFFIWPSTGTPESADAVVLFVGGKGERLEAALRLVRSGVADHLVIPNGTRPTWPQANRLCDGGNEFRVICPEPDPESTRGEARAIARVADEEGWDRVVLVTSNYHVTRARILLSRCFDGTIDAVGANPDLRLARHAQRVTHEVAGLAEAMFVNNGC